VLIGHPVAHSLSAAMQNAAFAHTGRPERYEAVDVPPERLAAYVGMLRQGAYLGANITLPYKLAVAELLDELDGDAAAMGAVNTITVQDRGLVGYNTDVHGAWEGLLGPVRDSLLASRILILGAGGGARAILLALARAGQYRPREVVVTARSTDAREAAVEVGLRAGLNCRGARWGTLGQEAPAAGILVNCTPLGLHGEDPLADFPLAGKVVLDLAYLPGGTALFQRGWREGAVALQGDDMLLHQGARAFTLWTGVTAPLEVMRRALKQALNG
jgi:shikimate dehydrogenase